eukprot:CAMPEP_0195297884 /NCGR_PEP_ID=MMETSP0707-20130614/22318_1 /TAXON_ID=33640 /ORGANISM="Asterionellopsis glacialis, Strain CCMP134" /LENGTH=251 /DNA_ID=CAMNT_0040359807 /DNA_START=17 /DNA_END=769 /DNA_ORIENTATION=+
MGLLWSTASSEWEAEGKTVLITGASSGIGAEVARNFARKGANLALVARRKDALERICEECKQLGSPRAEVITCDLTDNSNIKSAMEKAVSIFKGFDVVVLNAGRSQGCYFEEIKDVDQIDHMLKLNVNGVITSLHYLLPSIYKSRHSRIVIISSVAGLIGALYRTIYCASKHALTGFSSALRLELKDTYGSEAPAVCLVNFPEVAGTELNTGRMDFGADCPPVEFDASSASPLSSACEGLMDAIGQGKREW